MNEINAKNVRTLRGQRNWTLDDLAEKAKIERGTISKIENGKRPKPRSSTVRKLANALNVEPETLTGPDLEDGERTPVFARKTQLNFKMADDARNALSLVALRYNVRPADILHLAPFLFYWAAEESLNWRREKLDEAFEKLSALSELKMPRHINGLATNHWRGEEMLEDERRSIAHRDIFARRLKDDSVPPEFEESEQNPMAQFLASVADRLDDDVEFEYWSPHWSHPGYTLGLSEARKLCGGDDDAARHIVHGNAPLHEMPKEVRDAGGTAIAEWAIKVGDESLRNLTNIDEFAIEGDRTND